MSDDNGCPVHITDSLPMWDPWEPDRPYVYQPYGALTHELQKDAGRLWGVGGVSLLTDIKGLTREEAEAVAKALGEVKQGEGSG